MMPSGPCAQRLDSRPCLVTGLYLARSGRLKSDLWWATLTPLSSIIGRGLLIMAPLLASIVGPLSPAAIVGIVLLAYAIGHVIRFNIVHVEPRLAEGRLHRATVQVESPGNVVLVMACIVAVAFYLSLLWSFLLAWLALSKIRLWCARSPRPCCASSPGPAIARASVASSGWNRSRSSSSARSSRPSSSDSPSTASLSSPARRCTSTSRTGPSRRSSRCSQARFWSCRGSRPLSGTGTAGRCGSPACATLKLSPECSTSSASILLMPVVQHMDLGGGGARLARQQPWPADRPGRLRRARRVRGPAGVGSRPAQHHHRRLPGVRRVRPPPNPGRAPLRPLGPPGAGEADGAREEPVRCGCRGARRHRPALRSGGWDLSDTRGLRDGRPRHEAPGIDRVAGQPRRGRLDHRRDRFRHASSVLYRCRALLATRTGDACGRVGKHRAGRWSATPGAPWRRTCVRYRAPDDWAVHEIASRVVAGPFSRWDLEPARFAGPNGVSSARRAACARATQAVFESAAH